MRRDLQAQLEGWLDETGLPYSFVNGAKHVKVILNGKPLTVLPHGAGKNFGRRMLNIRAEIRRAARAAANAA